MQKTSVSLSVFHDGQFFTAVFERIDQNGYSVARRRFGQQPSNQQIMDMVNGDYARLRFSAAEGVEAKQVMHKNPKRRQREAAKAMRSVGRSTKVQAALSAERERCKTVRKAKRSANKKQLADEKFAQRQQKRKQKHKGH